VAPRLNWREAHGRDRTVLQAFSCTALPGRDRLGRLLPYARRWEREVEAGVRTLTPPIGNGALHLGFDEVGLAAVSLISFLAADGDHFVGKLRAVAVDLRCRGRGYGVEAVEVALLAAGDRAFGLGYALVDVVSQVHKENHASKAMSTRAGLRRLHDEFDEDLEEWGTTLEGPENLCKQ